METQNTAKMSQGIKELERCYDFFNGYFYDGKLPDVVITVQAAGRLNAYGWFCGDAWVNKETRIPEINLCAEWFNRPILEVMSTLIHEMVHLENFIAGIKDCSANQYHNKKFKIAAEKIGFEVEKTNHGYSQTVLTPAIERGILKAETNADLLSIFRGSEAPQEKKPGSKLKKWACSCTNIRVAIADFDATCNSCGEQFKLEE